MKYLAIDYGQKRVGLALGDEQTAFAHPAGLIERKTKDYFWRELLAKIEQVQPNAIVIGLPLHQDGTECLCTRQCRNFAASLKRRCELPIFMVNELLTSFEAELELKQRGLGRAKLAQALDQQAAVAIMRTFFAQPPNQRISYA